MKWINAAWSLILNCVWFTVCLLLLDKGVAVASMLLFYHLMSIRISGLTTALLTMAGLLEVIYKRQTDMESPEFDSSSVAPEPDFYINMVFNILIIGLSLLALLNAPTSY